MSKPAHHAEDGGFQNPWTSFKHSKKALSGFLPNMRSKEPSKYDLAAIMLLSGVPDFKLGEESVQQSTRNIAVTWIGHSTYVIQMAGVTILTDPVWNVTTAKNPFSSDGITRRVLPPVCPIDKLPPIDVVLVSNNKKEHLDLTVVEHFKDATWLVPIGVANMCTENGAVNVQEMDWYQSTMVNGHEFACTPAQHYCLKDSPEDPDSLWCTWAILGQRASLFFAGATGYRYMKIDTFDMTTRKLHPYCPEFKKIGKDYGPFTLSIVPIGGSQPRGITSSTFCDTLDGVCVHRDVKAKQSIPGHWGAFFNSDEGLLDPVRKLEMALNAANVHSSDFLVIYPGRTTIYR